MPRRLSALLVTAALLAPLSAAAHDDSSPATGEKLGAVQFAISCNAEAQQRFSRAVAILHSFWYEEAVKAFTGVAEADPSCAMAWWGIAMSHWYQLWYPPAAPALKAGAAAVAKAEGLDPKTERERDYIGAIAAFYRGSDTIDHRTRALAYRAAMANLHQRYPDDREAAIFYALALDGTALPTDKSLVDQKKAAAILEPIFKEQPDHPGVAHYLIHSYDAPPLAEAGLPAARRYAEIAPSVPHALHMPSHIFTRLGYWQESIDTNRRSAEAGQAYAKTAFGDGVVWDQSLHAMDYLAYAYLQQAQDEKARGLVDEIAGFVRATPETAGAAYALAAIPARYAVERRRWAEAAKLEVPSGSPGGKLSWAEATTYYARALGCAHTGDIEEARLAIQKLEADRNTLVELQETYWAGQVEIQRREAAGMLASAQGKKDEALELLRSAADMEDASEKHPVTPGPVVPARELLAEFLLTTDKPADALVAFESTLERSPNRFNALYGAASAAQNAGQREKARQYYSALVEVSDPVSPRPELRTARSYLQEVASK